MHTFLVMIISLFVITSCTTQNQTGVEDRQSAKKGKEAAALAIQPTAAGAGSYALEIIPKKADRNSSLSLISNGFELSDAAITWVVNGSPFSSASAQQVNPGELKKDDMVQARAIVNGKEIVSDQITIQNTAPRIAKVELVMEAISTEMTFKADVSGQDIDGDEITYLYEWTKNGNPAGTGNRMEGAIKRGDNVLVKIIPFDGTDYGRAVLARRDIANLRPVITAHKEFSFDGTMYTYQVKATDPDGDVLAYSLESPPDGVTIDPATGLLKWIVPKEFKGKKEVSIVVSDGNGGTAQYGLEMIIQ